MQGENNLGNTIFSLTLDTSSGENSSVQAVPLSSDKQENWSMDHQEGQLAVDVAETKDELLVVSTMAGAQLDSIEVYVHGDLLTIRGTRISPLSRFNNLHEFHTECFWGVFSRTIVLPVDVKGDMARAEYHSGVLEVHLPKQTTIASIPITIVEE